MYLMGKNGIQASIRPSEESLASTTIDTFTHLKPTKTAQTKGCQINYLVQTRAKNLFLCEFKFKRRELRTE